MGHSDQTSLFSWESPHFSYDSPSCWIPAHKYMRLRSFCEFLGQKYHNILRHSNVHCLFMFPALERVLKNVRAIETNILLSYEQCSKIHRLTFGCPLSMETLKLYTVTRLRCLKGRSAVLRSWLQCWEILSQNWLWHDDNFIPVFCQWTTERVEQCLKRVRLS